MTSKSNLIEIANCELTVVTGGGNRPEEPVPQYDDGTDAPAPTGGGCYKPRPPLATI